MSTSDRKTQPYGALARHGHARLTIVSGLCPEGLTWSLSRQDHKAGRTDTDVLLSEDPYVSPHHATFSYRDGRLVVQDDNSANGVYLRIRGPHLLENGEQFRVGDQLFRFESLDQRDEHPGPDGTLYFTSPKRKGGFRVLQILEGGRPGLSSTSSNDELTIGGEGSSVAFSADPHLSKAHCRIYASGGDRFAIEDTNSTNGTYVRVKGQSPLGHGDLLWLGRTLLRVDVS